MPLPAFFLVVVFLVFAALLVDFFLAIDASLPAREIRFVFRRTGLGFPERRLHELAKATH